MDSAGRRSLAIDSIAEAVSSVVRNQPKLIGSAVVVLLAVLLGGWLLRRYISGGKADRLLSVLEDFDDLAILMHPNPDPDSMGAALGVQELAMSQGTNASIYYSGQIRHQENRAFTTVLDLDFDRIQDREELTEAGTVLVDHNVPRGFTGAKGMEPDVVIDHHPGTGTGASFTDIRSECGACASIVAEYFERLDAAVPGDEPEATDGGTMIPNGAPQLTPTVATGLLYGIQADTDHLTQGCSTAEFEAAAYLFPVANQDQLHRIANPQVTAEMLEIKAKAIQDRIINGAFAISDVGLVNDIDAIPQAAEELVRLEGISAVVVYGSADNVIHLSGRSRDDRIHMGRTLENVFEDVPMASAGGHARMGGGQVPLQYLAGIGPSAVDEDRARSDLRGMLFNALQGNA